VKTKLLTLFQDFVRVSFCFLPVIFVIRLLEYVTLHSLHNLPPGSGHFIFSGFWADLMVFGMIAIVALIPFLIVGLLSRRVASYGWLAMMVLYSFLHFALIKYFSVTLVPLDQVVFSYTLKEMVMISASSAKFTVLSFFPFLLLLALILTCFYFLRRWKPGPWLIAAALFLFAISPLLLKRYNPKPVAFERDFDYFLTINKPLYLLQKCRQYYKDGIPDKGLPGAPDAAMLAQFSLYQSNHPEFRFVGPTYPLLHVDDTPDVLGSLFNLGDQKPNLVFIIVESLSSSFCGDRPMFGSFTPFLDSLSGQGLYWKNCLSSSERTFYVLPALFASLPYGSGMYLENLSHSSYNLSLIRYLNNNGYVSRFYYGGDPAFNQMDNFLRRNHTGYILTTWGPGYSQQAKEERGFEWGYPDHELFRRSFEVMDSMNSSPYLDIYLTLSMHAPFTPPDKERYAERYVRRLDELKLSETEKRDADKYKDIYTTVLYTDDALRSFFREYRKRPGYANTIFFITGDHSMPELNVGWYSPLERCRVPFIIWSPMLKGPKSFNSVVTHNDVTPSVLAMLKSRYDIETHPLSHWIGTGLDTTKAFRAARSVVLIRNNKEMTDYVDSGFCLSEGRLYRMRPDMKAVPVNDPTTADRLLKKLANYVTVTQYVGTANSMIPIWMMFGKKITEQEIPVSDGIQYYGDFSSDGYLSVLKKMRLAEEYKYISLNVTFRFFSLETDPEKIPKLVFEVADTAGRTQIWNQYPLFGPGGYKQGQSNSVVFRESMDLSCISGVIGCTARLYLWNKDGITLKLDSLERKLTGYK
jgi:phosphoglycerol transferase MdoB-like AlkP superfamily enzyme